MPAIAEKQKKVTQTEINLSADPTKNREAWLAKVANALIPHVEAAAGKKMPKFRITMSFPSHRALSKKKRVIGQCWAATANFHGVHEVLVSLVIEDEMEIAATVAHEMLHAAVGLEHKHGAKFSQAAKKLGLIGPPTATSAGPEFEKIAKPILKGVGFKLPHAKLTANPLVKTQTTRLIKCYCEDCGYTVRTTIKWIEGSGAPLCPTPSCEKKQMKADMPEWYDPDGSDEGEGGE